MDTFLFDIRVEARTSCCIKKSRYFTIIKALRELTLEPYNLEIRVRAYIQRIESFCDYVALYMKMLTQIGRASCRERV